MLNILIAILIVLHIPLWVGFIGMIAYNVNFIVDLLIREWHWSHSWDEALH